MSTATNGQHTGSLLPRRRSPDEESRMRWREATVQHALPAAAMTLGPLVAHTCYRAYQAGHGAGIALPLAAYVFTVFAAIWRALPYAVRAVALLSTPSAVAIVQCLALGSVESGAALLLAGTLLVTVLAGSVAGLVALGLSAVLVLGCQWLSPPASEVSGVVQTRAGSLLAYVSASGLVVVVASQLRRHVAALLSAEDEGRAQLRARNTMLGQRVNALLESNARLEGRAEALGALVGIAGHSAAEGGLRELLRRTATLISQRFGFYHVGIFLVDVSGDWVVLEAASSEGGRRMLARQHRLRVGQEGVVGNVAARGEPRVVMDVERDAIYYQNPDLPETRSEIAVPLVFGDRVLGVLDVQDTEQGTFQQDDVVLMQTLSELIVVAIQNVRTFGELREAIVAERRSYADLSERAWLQRTRRGGPIGYRYERGRVSRLEGVDPEDGARERERADLSELRLPVSVRGRVIGSLNAHKPAGSSGWSAAEREAMESLVSQLDAALESARLYEDTQQLAARERTLAEIASRMRETLDVQAVLRTAADQVYQALDLEEVVIRFAESPGVDASTGEA